MSHAVAQARDTSPARRKDVALAAEADDLPAAPRHSVETSSRQLDDQLSGQPRTDALHSTSTNVSCAPEPEPNGAEHSPALHAGQQAAELPPARRDSDGDPNSRGQETKSPVNRHADDERPGNLPANAALTAGVYAAPNDDDAAQISPGSSPDPSRQNGNSAHEHSPEAPGSPVTANVLAEPAAAAYPAQAPAPPAAAQRLGPAQAAATTEAAEVVEEEPRLKYQRLGCDLTTVLALVRTLSPVALFFQGQMRCSTTLWARADDRESRAASKGERLGVMRQR